MFKNELIEVKVHSRNISHYEYILGSKLSISDNIFISVSDLTLGSNVEITGICDICLSERLITYKVYNAQTKNGTEKFTCSKICSVEKSKLSNVSKYGFDNVFKSEKIKSKIKKSLILKYGVDNPMKSEIIRNKAKLTNLDKFGVEYPSSCDSIKRKVKLTNLDKFGVEYPAKSPLILEKMKKSCFEKYGFDNFSKTDKFATIIKKKSFNNMLNKLDKFGILLENTQNNLTIKCCICLSDFTIGRSFMNIRIINGDDICLYCNPILSGMSKLECELLEFISDNYKGEIVTSNRSILDGKELDIYLPELNLAFEFNVLYWHSELYKDRLYHMNKTNECLDKGIQLVHIWEDDWLYKKNIIKSIILNKLGYSEKIYARKCSIREVNNTDVREFLNLNHIQGFVGSKVKLGLYHNEELVSLMTFGSLRKSLGQKSEDGVYELLRFCNRSGTSVIGGASKLFKYFIKNDVKSIVSYSDNSRGVGNLYKQLGFEFINESIPNYYYIIDGVRKHRFNFRKDKLVKEGSDPSKTEIQIMNDKGIYRIFDCGSKKWNFDNIKCL